MSALEIFSFGMLMPNRSFNADNQRFLFQNMEQDMEISGSGNSYTTEFRQYDPRLWRWKSLDALMYMFPHLSPYVGFDNNPIYFVDPYGLSSEKGDGGGENAKSSEGVGEVFVGDDGEEYSTTHVGGEGKGNVKAHYRQKIANIKKELVQVYIRELIFESHKRNDGGDDEGENWFFGTLRYLDEQFDKLKGERREQWRGVQLKTEDGTEVGDNEDLPKSKNPDIPDFDYEVIDDLSDLLKAKRKMGGITNKMKDRADLLRELNALYRQVQEKQKTAIEKRDEKEVKKFIPHKIHQGDSVLIEIDDEGDTTSYQHSRNRNSFLNNWAGKIDNSTHKPLR